MKDRLYQTSVFRGADAGGPAGEMEGGWEFNLYEPCMLALYVKLIKSVAVRIRCEQEAFSHFWVSVFPHACFPVTYSYFPVTSHCFPVNYIYFSSLHAIPQWFLIMVHSSFPVNGLQRSVFFFSNLFLFSCELLAIHILSNCISATFQCFPFGLSVFSREITPFPVTTRCFAAINTYVFFSRQHAFSCELLLI